MLFERGVLSPAAHMAWTGLAAAALWRAAIEHWRPRALGGSSRVFVVAVLLHTAWDSAPNLAVDVVVAVVSLVAALVDGAPAGRTAPPRTAAGGHAPRDGLPLSAARRPAAPG